MEASQPGLEVPHSSRFHGDHLVSRLLPARRGAEWEAVPWPQAQEEGRTGFDGQPAASALVGNDGFNQNRTFKGKTKH